MNVALMENGSQLELSGWGRGAGGSQWDRTLLARRMQNAGLCQHQARCIAALPQEINQYLKRLMKRWAADYHGNVEKRFPTSDIQ